MEQCGLSLLLTTPCRASFAEMVGGRTLNVVVDRTLLIAWSLLFYPTEGTVRWFRSIEVIWRLASMTAAWNAAVGMTSIPYKPFP